MATACSINRPKKTILSNCYQHCQLHYQKIAEKPQYQQFLAVKSNFCFSDENTDNLKLENCFLKSKNDGLELQKYI